MKKLLLLFLLVAGGVSTASAWTTVKLPNSVEGVWSSSAATTMTKINDNLFQYVLNSSTITDENGYYYFKIYVTDDNGFWGGSYENGYDLLSVTDYTGQTNTNDYNVCSFNVKTDKTSKYIISVSYTGSAWKFVAAKYSRKSTITFVNTENYSDIRAYVYCSDNSKDKPVTGAWPGTTMTNNGDGTYSLKDINYGTSAKVIISDNGSSTDRVEVDLAGDIVVDADGIVSSQTITLNSYGMATYCSKYPLDFSTATVTEGDGTLAAYKIIENNKLTGALTKSGLNKVPAGTGIYLEGTPNKSFTVGTTVSATSVDNNMLKGVVVDTPIGQTEDEGTTTNYILTVNKAGGNVDTPKFFKVNSAGNTVLANRAYLQIPTEDAARESFWFDGDVTAIEKNLTPALNEGVVYDLQGRKVMNPAKGLYIVNGKKVIK